MAAITRSVGTPIIWAVSPTWAPTSSNWSTTPNALITLASIANGAGRQGGKIDLGASWKQLYIPVLRVEFQATPTSGAAATLAWAPSNSATAGNDNPGGCTGADGAFSDADLFNQLIIIGALHCDNAASVQQVYLGEFRPPTQYGSPVVWNASGATLDADNIQQGVILIPITETIA